MGEILKSWILYPFWSLRQNLGYCAEMATSDVDISLCKHRHHTAPSDLAAISVVLKPLGCLLSALRLSCLDLVLSFSSVSDPGFRQHAVPSVAYGSRRFVESVGQSSNSGGYISSIHCIRFPKDPVDNGPLLNF